MASVLDKLREHTAALQAVAKTAREVERVLERVRAELIPLVNDLQSMAIEVKGGRNVGIATLRALRGVLENEAAQMAGLIVLHPLSDASSATSPMSWRGREIWK